MKPLLELEKMLLDEIKFFKKGKHDFLLSKYYNEVTGDMSTILTYMLSKHLSLRDDWDGSWLDDSLLTKIIVSEHKFCIWGILITGRENTTEQWTNPFYFEITTTDEYKNFVEYTFLLGDENSEEVSYTEFRENRDIWDLYFYSDNNWNPSERSWEYIINIKPGHSK
ncbi:hypothetical protein [Flavobacterium sp.]|uniref:hypothetical protein n=1 Tax=Flavobacterium sp. TaxID=239 RepID=UPI002620DA63|nr:hypothetical protein [Flavobacterium sp.]